MTLSFNGGKTVLSLATAPFAAPASPARWLVALRWVAIVGMAVTSLAAGRAVPALDVTVVLAIVAVLAALNLAWTVLVRLAPLHPSVSVGAQIIIDVVVLTAVLWFSGGVTNPFASFLSFQIMLAGLLASRRVTIGVTVLAICSAGISSMAPPLSLLGAPLGVERVRLLADVVSLVALGTFTGFFIAGSARRLDVLREQSARSEKLAVLGRSVAALSHELNTPLGTILLAARDLHDVGREIEAPDVSRLSQTIVEEAQRASDVIGLLRGYVRPDARREVLDACAFVAGYVQRELDRLGFDGERMIRVCQPVEAVVLRAALCQVLTNVLANAVDATTHVEHKLIEVDVTDHPTTVEVSVRDNGPGISPKLLPTLGEPFQTTKADQGGTGLGLYVSGLLAERMGATLQLESSPGKGTAVTLSLTKNHAGA